jgi:ketosteroid isomerase-like protein
VAAVEAEPALVVRRFNEFINQRDLDGLTGLMSEGHTFVDSTGAAVNGRPACADAWQGFFAAFPDYRNVFTEVTVTADIVVVVGHSVCSEPALAGPALWTATVHDGLISRWQVLDDTTENRRRFGV